MDATAPALPGIFRGLGDQVEGPIGHNDINPVLFAGVIDDLSAGGKSANKQVGNTEFLAISEKSNFTKLLTELDTY